MHSKGHFISTSVFIVLLTLISGIFTPAFSQDDSGHFTLQLIHAADMEGDIEALENAPRLSSERATATSPDRFSQRETIEVFAAFWEVRDQDVRIS